MMKVNVKDLDELIHLSKQYWKTGDVDILISRRASLLDILLGIEITRLINSCINLNKNCTYETIHKIVELLGFELVG